MRDEAGIRGALWFHMLTGQSQPLTGDPASVLVSDADLGEEEARFLCVVPNPEGRFPCARHGEVGLEEAYALAARVREITRHDGNWKKQPIIAIVDLKSQAYGRREETAAIYLAAAAAADAYGSARLAGHPVIALVVGQALSGGFLTHGYQANRILAFDDAGVMIHAMHKAAAARHTTLGRGTRSARKQDRPDVLRHCGFREARSASQAAASAKSGRTLVGGYRHGAIRVDRCHRGRALEAH